MRGSEYTILKSLSFGWFWSFLTNKMYYRAFKTSNCVVYMWKKKRKYIRKSKLLYTIKQLHLDIYMNLIEYKCSLFSLHLSKKMPISSSENGSSDCCWHICNCFSYIIRQYSFAPNLTSSGAFPSKLIDDLLNLVLFLRAELQIE